MTYLALVWQYRRAIAFLALAVAAFFAVRHVQQVFEERDQLRQDKAVLSVKLEAAQAMVELNNRIAEAISQIKIRSNVNVSRIESEPAPQFVDTRPIPFIPGGLPQGVYTSAAADRALSGSPASGTVPAREPARGVLSH